MYKATVFPYSPPSLPPFLTHRSYMMTAQAYALAWEEDFPYAFPINSALLQVRVRVWVRVKARARVGIRVGLGLEFVSRSIFLIL